MKLCKLGIHKKIVGNTISSDDSVETIYYIKCEHCHKVLNAFVVERVPWGVSTKGKRK